MATEFEKQLEADIKGIFLQENAQDAIYTSGSVLKPIRIQFFLEPLDKMGTLYEHAWCAFSDMPNVSNNDRLEVNGIVYGIMDFTPDEFGAGVDLFLQKIEV